jgi:membrane fusion protein, multidrug efflux system
VTDLSRAAHVPKLTVFLCSLAAASILASPFAVAQIRGAGPVAVNVEPVSVRPLVETLPAVGSLGSNQSIIARPEVAGVIKEIRVDDGAEVKKGQLLFRLDSSIQEAELAQAEAGLRLAMRNYKRAEDLFESGSGTVRARDEALSAMETGRAAAELARAQLDKTRIVAPFNGVAGLRQVDVGDYVKVGDDLISLDEIDPVKVDFNVPERFLRFVEPGQQVNIAVDALPGENFTGRIYAISPRADPAGRSLAVRATIPNPDHRLKPGLFARVEIVTKNQASSIFVPEEAVIPQGDEVAVYRVIDGKAVLTKVKVGLRRYGRAEIVEGLKPDDVVITGGTMKVRDGVPVQPLAEAGQDGG